MTQSEALSILKTGANVFLTGKPGSGKTHTVNEYVEWLRSCGIEPSITASTGIAATHIHGMTIHSWSGIGIRDSLSEYDLDIITSKEHVSRRIQKASTLIIDEISMLSAGVLHMVDEVCRAVRKNAQPFGGIQVVLVGDFFQLPPIAKAGREAAPFAFESNVWEQLHLLVCYLTEQHRQDDSKFLSVLDAIRDGEADHTTVSTIMAREVSVEELDEDTPRLFTHNVDVDRINNERLESISTPGKKYVMKGTGAPLLIEGLKRGCLSPELLILKEGAVVMGTKNLPMLGIANGTIATVIGFERGTDFPLIETMDGRTLTIAPADWAVEENGKARATVSQIPLRLAWAITVHKSQGMSMDTAAIDLSRAFEYGQGYVALSRVRSLAGLHIVGWSEGALMVHPKVRAFDEQFRALSEAAQTAFADLEVAGERIQMETKFIKASGGVAPEVDPKTGEKIKGTTSVLKRSTSAKPDTYGATLELAVSGMGISEIAKSRGLTLGTICSHIEKLLQAGKIAPKAVSSLLPESVQKSASKIHTAFTVTKSVSLTSAYDHLDGLYTFDEIRLARLMYEVPSK